jgi:hypothetical protein
MPSHPDDGSPFFQLARTVIQQANFSLGIHIEEPERILSHYDRVQHLLHAFVKLSHIYRNVPTLIDWQNTAIQTLHQIVAHLESINEYAYDIGNEDAAIPHAIIPQFEKIQTGGRPQIALPWNTITAFRKSNHSWKEIATILGISRRTLRRYRLRYDYEDPNPFSNITDNELDNLVGQICNQNAGVIGYQFMLAALQDQGHRVSRRRVRASMARTDLLGSLERWATIIPRTVYNVRSPNSLWHMDGNLKLAITYGFVLHGAIDGYSRRIIYLECNTNNRAPTVLSAFLRGIASVNAIPHRVRADKGGENRDVAMWMLATNGTDRGSFITGRSVHNQRIERLWRDVNRWLTVFHLVFLHLQQNNIYDSDNEIDKFTLIFVYYPLMQRSLHQFARIWNHHKLRTEHHRSPIQLYADGNPGSLWMPTCAEELQQYGIDWNGPVPVDDDENETAVVEPPRNPLSDQDRQILEGHFKDQLYPVVEILDNNIMSPQFNYGVDIYFEVREWIKTRLANYIGV